LLSAVNVSGLDPTRIVDSLASVISIIELEHTGILGNTIDRIFRVDNIELSLVGTLFRLIRFHSEIMVSGRSIISCD
jgi:hypothetical protein